MPTRLCAESGEPMTSGLLSPVHIALVLAVALMLFGAKRLPEVGKSLGTGLRTFKHSLEGRIEEETPQPATPASPPLEVVSERRGPRTAE